MDISLSIVPISNGQQLMEKVASISIPDSFNELKYICRRHYSNNCERSVCDHISHYTWSVYNDCDKRRGDRVVTNAQRILDKLERWGISPMIINDTPGWKSGDNMNPKEKLKVFAYHILRSYRMGKKYPDHYFVLEDDYGKPETSIFDPDTSQKIRISFHEDVYYNLDTDDEYKIGRAHV